MTPAAFRASLAQATPPALPMALLALWWDARGDWDRAHECAMQDSSAAGSAVHAYLHRKEGDVANARYWYRRARVPVASGPLAAELDALVATLLAD